MSAAASGEEKKAKEVTAKMEAKLAVAGAGAGDEEETIFDKIVSKSTPADILYEDDLSLAFKDVNPTVRWWQSLLTICCQLVKGRKKRRNSGKK